MKKTIFVWLCLSMEFLLFIPLIITVLMLIWFRVFSNMFIFLSEAFNPIVVVIDSAILKLAYARLKK